MNQWLETSKLKNSPRQTRFGQIRRGAAAAAEGSPVPAGEQRMMGNTGLDRGVGGDSGILKNQVAVTDEELGRGRETN
jgi:hypothetical protein